MFNAELRSIDVVGTAICDFKPADLDCFGVWVSTSIGPSNAAGADLFEILVCSNKWLNGPEGAAARDGQRYIVVRAPFHGKTVEATIRNFVNSCRGKDWQEIADFLSIKAYWEFENYKP